MSNKIIDEAMVEVRRLSAEALDMMSKANKKYDCVEERVIKERNCASDQLRQERAHHSRESARLKQKLTTMIDKLHRDQESSMKVVQSKSNKKYEKVRQDVEEVSHKLKEQCVAWQKRLSDMDSSSKILLSKKQARRRNIVQQQLDRTSAVEGQLMEIIEGLEVMNYELEDKVKSAKKAKRKAIRLYDKSKEAASRRLDQLQVEKEQKSLLKDELTRTLKAQQAQENQLTEYKAMVETFKSTKRSLARKVKIGHSGGAHWPLWVTKVCCELLVNGSPPLAIPSSMGTLFSTLYGKEPKKIPLLSYVCQCGVLI